MKVLNVPDIVDIQLSRNVLANMPGYVVHSTSKGIVVVAYCDAISVLDSIGCMEIYSSISGQIKWFILTEVEYMEFLLTV